MIGLSYNRLNSVVDYEDVVGIHSYFFEGTHEGPSTPLPRHNSSSPLLPHLIRVFQWLSSYLLYFHG
jgi:hypothetical protein